VRTGASTHCGLGTGPAREQDGKATRAGPAAARRPASPSTLLSSPSPSRMPHI